MAWAVGVGVTSLLVGMVDLEVWELQLDCLPRPVASVCYFHRQNAKAKRRPISSIEKFPDAVIVKKFYEMSIFRPLNRKI